MGHTQSLWQNDITRLSPDNMQGCEEALRLDFRAWKHFSAMETRIMGYKCHNVELLLDADAKAKGHIAGKKPRLTFEAFYIRSCTSVKFKADPTKQRVNTLIFASKPKPRRKAMQKLAIKSLSSQASLLPHQMTRSNTRHLRNTSQTR